MQKNILIASYFFSPENVPRAFRTFELAKELSRQGHFVTLYIPDYDNDYSDISNKYNLNIKKVKTGFLFNKNKKKKLKHNSKVKININNNFKKRSFINKIENFLIFLFGEKKIEYGFEIFKQLLKEKKKYDLLISISYPIYVHMGVALALLSKKELANTKVADCGDPFYYNQNKKMAFYHKYFEKFILNKFDYITVPTEKAVSSYYYFKESKNIKVIPHGFDLSAVKTSKYHKNKILTFGYAGAFEQTLRNPELLFEYLINLDKNFKFIIYLTKPKSTIGCIKSYINKLGEKLVLIPNTPREQVIYELSKCDFLINVENTTSNQMPSKIVDYKLAKRPIFSFHPDKFEHRIFEEFLSGDYKEQLDVNIENYDIRRVAGKFLELS